MEPFRDWDHFGSFIIPFERWRINMWEWRGGGGQHSSARPSKWWPGCGRTLTHVGFLLFFLFWGFLGATGLPEPSEVNV